MKNLYLTMVFGALVLAGFATPFAAALCYVWVDIFTPQYVAYSILTEVPVAFVAAVLALVTYLLADRRAMPRPYPMLIMMGVFLLWCTFTTFNDPVAPGPAWFKFDWAGKQMLFAMFMPFVFRSRVQIEAFLLVYLFSAAANFIPFGVKTLYSGGGYGLSLGLIGFNSGLGEGSFLATTCASLIPVMAYLHRYGTILPRWKILLPLYPTLAVLAVACAFGTYERTALFGIAIALFAIWLRTKRRMLTGPAIALAVLLAVANAPAAWLARMNTVRTYSSEGSAYVRLLIWQWTMDFVSTHPLGGGFSSFVINEIHLPDLDGTGESVQHGRAFHSIYFEVLGEHGYPGLFLYVTLIVMTFMNFRYVARWAGDDPDFAWLRSLAQNLTVSAAAVFTCGAFIGVAFQSVVWYLFAAAVMLRHHVGMCESEARRIAQRRSSLVDDAGSFAAAQ